MKILAKMSDTPGSVPVSAVIDTDDVFMVREFPIPDKTILRVDFYEGTHNGSIRKVYIHDISIDVYSNFVSGGETL